MKSFLLTVWLIGVAALLPLRAEVTEAAALAGVIQSGASAAEKQDACQRLKIIGTASSVSALATLLPDEHLYQAACDALETLPFVEADQALQAALSQASGRAKAGIIHALGERRNPSVIPTVAGALLDSDPLVADGAARALGKIGGAGSVKVLRARLKPAAPPLRAALVDALLQCARELAVTGDKVGARKIFEQFNSDREVEPVRAAAFAGLLRLAGDQALDRCVKAIRGKDSARQLVALQLARDVVNPKATRAFTNLLRNASPAMQAALIGLLQQRDDAGAAPAVLGLAQSQDPYVRVTAIAALGPLGDAPMVPFLAGVATSRDEADQKAARVALLQLRRGPVGAAMVKEISVAKPEVQAELARALGGRWEKSAVPALLELARSRTETTRSAAIRALSLLADGSHLSELVKLLGEAATEAARADVRGVFESVVDRADASRAFDVAPIVAAMSTAKPEVQAALLQVASIFADERLRTAFRAALQSSDATIRAAAGRALCAARDAGLIPELLELARTHPDLTLRALALEGYIRLVSEERSGFSAAKKLELLMPAYELASRAEERKRVLSALGNVPLRGALELTARALPDAAVQAEAEIACTQIAKALLASDPDSAERMLQQLAENASSESSRTNAHFILKQFDSGWRYAGPYREKDKAGNELFDVVFPPEQGDSAEVKWLRAPGTTRTGEVALSELTGGDHCVMYLKTRIFAPTARTVKLEIGSDDGIKLWVNGEVVHANNTGRGVVPGQDQAQANLREGWNDFRAKITQLVGGCAMILEIKSEEGKKIKGLRLDPRGGEK